eukprot:899652_1
MPSVAPSLPPSVAPSFSPTQNPSRSPSDVPSYPPSNAPSDAPSNAPTNNPIASDDFDSFLEITYVLNGTHNNDKEKITGDPLNVTDDIENVIKNAYVADGPISYDDFLIDIQRIQGTQIAKINALTMRKWTRLESLELQTLIECNDFECRSIREQSKDVDTNGLIGFAQSVTDTLQIYFGNEHMEFRVKGDVDALEIVSKYASDKTNSTSADYVLYGIISICGLLGLIGILAFLFNKGHIPRFSGSNVVDNGKFAAVFVFTLQLWDFYSDVNLSVEIWNHPQLSHMLVSAIGSTFFVIVPYIANLAVAAKIKQLIRDNQAAKSYFTHNSTIFTILVVITGGCYPALALVSSGVFGLEKLTSGLTRYELKRMSKIKVIGTVLLENVPQLICQALYAYAINEITQGVQLAFIASLLSITASTLGYLIDRDTSATQVVQYYLITECNARIKHNEHDTTKIETATEAPTIEGEKIKPQPQLPRAMKTNVSDNNNLNSNALRSDERENIINNRGRAKRLGESIAEVFGVPHTNIEIGYSRITKNGFITHIVHHVDHDDLDAMQHELQQLSGDNHPQIISPGYFTEKRHLLLQKDITAVMRAHF